MLFWEFFPSTLFIFVATEKQPKHGDRVVRGRSPLIISFTRRTYLHTIPLDSQKIKTHKNPKIKKHISFKSHIKKTLSLSLLARGNDSFWLNHRTESLCFKLKNYIGQHQQPTSPFFFSSEQAHLFDMWITFKKRRRMRIPKWNLFLVRIQKM